MRKEDLIAQGLTEEQAQKVLDSWNEAIKGFVPKTRFDEVNDKLKEANATIKTLEKNNQDNEALQAEVEAYKAKAADMEKHADITQKTYILKEKLKDAGALDADYLIFKQGGVEKFTFDKDGAPVGLEDFLKPLRESSPHLFKAQQGGYNPAGGGQPPTKNPWAKDSFNLTEQGRIYKENPALAKQMAEAAGSTI